MVKILLQIINSVAKVRHGLIHQNQSQNKNNSKKKKSFLINSQNYSAVFQAEINVSIFVIVFHLNNISIK